MQPRIKFAISSHEDYIRVTLPVLQNSLLAAGIPGCDIYWFVYGRNQVGYKVDRINYYPTAHNSLDFTGLVSVVDLELDSDWWFLLHDTTYVGDRFYSNLLSLNITDPVLPLSIHNVHPGANMGLYSREFINSSRDKILSFKNPSRLDEDVHDFKTMLVEKEDELFRGVSNSINKVAPKYIGPRDFYGNGQLRLIEHFQNADLYKVKANWSGYVQRWNVTP